MSTTPLDTPAAVLPLRRNRLPTRAGIGLKLEHAAELLAGPTRVGFLEIHAENFMSDGGPAHHMLRRLRERHALSIHGVGLSLGGEEPLDRGHLARLAELISRYRPESFSEHLAWSSHGGTFFNDLLPLAYTTPALHRVIAHVDEVQDRLGCRMLLENPSTYVAFAISTWDEPDFIAEVSRRTGCGLLLDVNNLVVSCVNHSRDPLAYLDALPLRVVGEIHLAGHAAQIDAVGAPLLIDNHGSAVAAAVWDIFDEAIARTAPQPTLIEWDNDVPPLERLLAEAGAAEARMSIAGLVAASVQT